MGLFFGTDGLRGKVNEDLTFDVAYKAGNALSSLKDRPTVLIGGDTRISRSYLTAGVAGGAMSGGANVIDAGVIPTAGIAYLTRTIGADYGVVISASHNSGEYNGIKVFGGAGYKLGDKEEERIERCFIHEKTNDFPFIGTYAQDFTLIKKYRDFLLSFVERPFHGKTIVLDCAFGAAHRIAPEIFRKAGASVVAVIYTFQKKTFMEQLITNAADVVDEKERLRKFSEVFSFTERESEVFNCLVNTEDSIQMIAEKLYVSRRTLERHISAIYEKTGVKSRVGLLNLYNK